MLKAEEDALQICPAIFVVAERPEKAQDCGDMAQSINPIKALRRLKRSLQKRALFRRFGQTWQEDESGFQNRTYASYQEYLTHQQSKLELHEFGDYDAKFYKALTERLVAAGADWKAQTVLCLAARLGTEVRAFSDLGCFAVGIDLNPGKENRYVLYGDFHALQFPAESVDCVFTNSLDHAFDIARIAAEILRVLKPNGLLLVEALKGKSEGANPGFFESFWWESIEGLVRIFESAGFESVQRVPIAIPWEGEALHFRRAPRLPV